jgi:hypothetical protein
MKIQDLIWDEGIYPRSSLNRKTVEAYVEALSIGAQFPAVMVQRVVNYTPGGDLLATVMILIDGVHRWHAFIQAGRTDIPVIHFQDAVLDYEAAKTELLLESARNNTSHGDRLTPAAREDPGRSITLFDYHRLLNQTGWKVIRRIECPLSTERLTGNQVQKMQTKRILGTIGRTLLIARRT